MRAIKLKKMTYCLGIKVAQGLVAIADTRITSGNETTTSRKVSTHQYGNNSIFIMTSGLRSIRDKAVTYFEELLDSGDFKYKKMYQAVNEFGQLLRRVAAEDKEYIQASGLFFNLNAIVGGQLEEDKEHKLYLLYPEGNWIEIGEATPFTIIGNTGYGTPILRRAITYQSDMQFALKTGFLSFDSTRVSASDVGYPLDVVLYQKNGFRFVEKRFTYNDMINISQQWAENLKSSIDLLPDEWTVEIMGALNH